MEKDLRMLAIEYTIRYFKGKNPTEEAFMRHLENVYKFLETGTIGDKITLSPEEQDIIKTFKQ
jgi:hypothetical protein